MTTKQWFQAFFPFNKFSYLYYFLMVGDCLLICNLLFKNNNNINDKSILISLVINIISLLIVIFSYIWVLINVEHKSTKLKNWLPHYVYEAVFNLPNHLLRKEINEWCDAECLDNYKLGMANGEDFHVQFANHNDATIFALRFGQIATYKKRKNIVIIGFEFEWERKIHPASNNITSF